VRDRLVATEPGKVEDVPGDRGDGAATPMNSPARMDREAHPSRPRLSAVVPVLAATTVSSVR
jgi:hypothetical protein